MRKIARSEDGVCERADSWRQNRGEVGMVGEAED